MSLTKNIIVDKIEVFPDGQIHVFEVTEILEDGERLGTPKGEWRVIDLDDDISGEEKWIKDVAKGLWTKTRVNARIKKRDAYIRK